MQICGDRHIVWEEIIDLAFKFVRNNFAKLHMHDKK